MLNHRTLAPLWPGGQTVSTPSKPPAPPVGSGAAETFAPAAAAAAPAALGRTAHHELLAWPPAFLGRFMAALAVVSVVFCAYLWQLSSVAAIKLRTDALHDAAIRLEHQNVDMMLQVALAEAPAQIDAQARALGMQPASAPLYVAVPQRAVAAAPVETAAVPSAAARAPWWRPVAALLTGRAENQGP